MVVGWLVASRASVLHKILMKNTNMTLYKGYKYGLIGEGGKSTLLAAISENKVDNFPDASEVKCVFVQTDIIGEKSHLSCLEYVLEDKKIQDMKFTEERVVESLLKFGVGNPSTNPNSPAQVGHGVSTLSGGWRRRLDLRRRCSSIRSSSGWRAPTTSGMPSTSLGSRTT